MGWVPINRRIEDLRDGLAVDPATVRDEVVEILDETTPARRVSPSARLRLVGLAVAAGRKLGDLEAADQIAAEGSMIATRSPVANADFLLHVAALRIVQEQPAEALRAVNQAEKLLIEELDKPQPSAKESQRRRRWMQSAVGVAHVTRGEVFLFLSEGSIDQAVADALEALRLTSNLVKAPSYTRRVHLSAVTLLCALLVRFGTPKIVDEAIRLLDHAEHILIYRCRVPPDHVHRIKIKWGRALALARLGSLSKAETLLLDVIERLLARDWKDDAKRALDALVWVVEQSEMPVRARYFVLKYRM